MSAGTLTLTNNSDIVTGIGTSFATEIAAGDFVVVTVGGVPYTLPVKSVESDTGLTLVSAYTGPTQSEAAWSAVPRVALNMVTAALVAQSAEALRGLNYDKQNWQQLFSNNGNITVTLPDGSQFSGPSWPYMISTVATKTNGAVPITQGGTGATNAEGARTSLGLVDSSGSIPISIGGTGAKTAADARENLELGTSATKNYTTELIPSNQLTAPVSLQTYNDFRSITSYDSLTSYPFGISAGIQDGNKVGATSAHASVITVRGWYDGSAPNSSAQWFAGLGPRGIGVRIPKASASEYFSAVSFWTTDNTTVSSDGTLKSASPIARVVKSQEECQRMDISENGFTWCGCGAANEEAEGVKISRLDVGVYVLTGSSGLASSGWQILPPMDPGGMGELGVVEAEQTEIGSLTIRLYKRKYMLSDDGEIIKTKGEPMDVPANSWIDVRLDMPENSIWNQRQKEAQEEIEKSVNNADEKTESEDRT
ncbi:TPA: phage tail protein [Citrobacter sedlakii]